MDTQRKADMINKVNADLKASYGKKHKKITQKDIEAVYKRNVLGIQADAKTSKGLGRGYLTGIMYFAPASLSGVNVCPKSSAGCRAACLFSAGRGRFYSINRARLVKTLAYLFDTPRFIQTVKKSIRQLEAKAKKLDLIPVVRLNGTSDILWERNTDILQEFSHIQFYDYTKIAKRFLFEIPANYHLTFSLSEVNDADAALVLSRGGNVAAVFKTANFPTEFMGYRVVSGDETDLRFLDQRGVIVALKAKGKAKQDTSGFVRDIPATAAASPCQDKAA